MTTKTSIIRRPAVAGQFYPGDPDELRSAVGGYLGTNHPDPAARGFAIWPEGAFAMPMGDVPIDSQLAHALMEADSRITFQRSAHQAEHSIEVQLPFLQRVQPGKKFVPIIVAEPTLENCEALAHA